MFMRNRLHCKGSAHSVISLHCSLKMSLFTLCFVAAVFMKPGMGTDSKRNPGLVLQYTEEYMRMFHQHILLNTELEKKVSKGFRLEIAEKLSTLFWSTARLSITDFVPTAFERPKADVSITSSSGVVLTVLLPTISFEGKYKLDYYNGAWFQYSKSGNVSVTILGTAVKMLRQISFTDNKEKIKWHSSNCNTIIDDLDINLHSDDSNLLLARMNIAKLKELVEEDFCSLPQHFIDVEVDLSYNITNDIYLDMTLLSQPIIHEGFLELYHKGEVRHKRDNTVFASFPRLFTFLYPSKTIVYRVSDFLFNSLGYVIHNLNLLSFTYTRLDLPKESKHLFNTTCETQCFGKLFPNASAKYPRSTVEMRLSTAESPRVQISSASLKVVFGFNINASIRLPNESIQLLFSVRLFLSALVRPSVKKSRIRLEMLHPESKITVLESQIGEVSEDLLLTVIEQVFQKILVPSIWQYEVDGLDLNLPGIFHVGEYRWSLESGGVSLLLDLLDIKTDHSRVILKSKQNRPRIFEFILGTIISSVFKSSPQRKIYTKVRGSIKRK